MELRRQVRSQMEFGNEGTAATDARAYARGYGDERHGRGRWGRGYWPPEELLEGSQEAFCMACMLTSSVWLSISCWRAQAQPPAVRVPMMVKRMICFMVAFSFSIQFARFGAGLSFFSILF